MCNARGVDPAEFRALLWKELCDGGVVLDGDVYRNTSARVTAGGLSALTPIRAAVGSSTWDRAAAEVGRCRQPDQIRILGYGRLLTEYATVWVDVPAVARENVVTLGALTNLIVTWYDQYVDHCAMPAVLPRWMLSDGLADRRHWLRLIAGSVGTPGCQLMSRLLDEYLTRLRELEGDRCMTPTSLLLRRTILAMYDAHATATTRSHSVARHTDHASVRKGALPFVVMALPVWLVANVRDRSLFAAHMRWTYRLGAFIGWIDDAIDLEQDREAGQANLVDRAFSGNAGGASARVIVRDIVRLGARVVADWHRRVRAVYGYGAARDMSDEVGAVLGATVYSWFAGATRRPFAFAESTARSVS
jgi:hypothetical protein